MMALLWELPSGKRLQNYGKSPFLMGKSAINGPCSIAMLVYQRVHCCISLRNKPQMVLQVGLEPGSHMGLKTGCFQI